jgi:hypothetical protein
MLAIPREADTPGVIVGPRCNSTSLLGTQVLLERATIIAGSEDIGGLTVAHQRQSAPPLVATTVAWSARILSSKNAKTISTDTHDATGPACQWIWHAIDEQVMT